MKRTTLATLITILTVSAGTARADDRRGQTLPAPVAAETTSTLPVAGAVDVSAPPGEIAPTRGAVLPALYASYAVLHAYDGYATIAGLQRGAREANPVMSRIAGKPGAVWAIKGGVAAASILVAERLWKRDHRAQAIATMVLSNGIMAVVAARNAALLRGQR